MQSGTEFKYYSEWRYLETITGLFWVSALPAAVVIIIIKIVYSQLGGVETVCLIFAFIAIALLEFAAVKIFSEGLYGFYRHNKTAIIIYDDCVEIFFSRKKFKTDSRIINFNDIRNFYFASGRKSKAGCCGTIFFDIADENKYFSATIYEAKTAAEFILEKLDFDQIDHRNNKVEKI